MASSLSSSAASRRFVFQVGEKLLRLGHPKTGYVRPSHFSVSRYSSSSSSSISTAGKDNNNISNGTNIDCNGICNSPSGCATTSEQRKIYCGPGCLAFGESEQQQCVINDLFMSYARTEPGPFGIDVPVLSVEDLNDLLISIGEKPSKKTLRRLVEEIDSDGNGLIELEEFLEGCDKVFGLSTTDIDNETIDVGELVNTFRTLDRDGNGVLTVDELDGLLSAAGGYINSEHAAEIMRLADRDRSGFIDLSEFINFVTDPEAGRYAWRLRSGFRVMLVIGGPGSGKGVLSNFMKERAGMQHYSSGDMLRQEVKSGSPLGKRIESTLAEGKLIASTTMIALIKKAIGKHPGALLALDGFPRTLENYRDFDAICGPPECAIHINVPDEVMIERILHRAATEGGRSDDNIETAQTRIQTYHELTRPTLDCLHENGIPVHTLDGTVRCHSNHSDPPFLGALSKRYLIEILLTKYINLFLVAKQKQVSPEGVWDQLMERNTPVRWHVSYANSRSIFYNPKAV